MDDYAYFLPGYTGFCPEIKDHFGETYGQLTRHIINEKPYLKDRLAPIFYKHRRSRMDKKGYRKYCDQEKDGYEPSKQRTKTLYTRSAKHRAVYDEDSSNTRRDGKAKYRTVYDDGDTNRDVRVRYHSVYDDGDTSRDCRKRYRAVCGDGDNRDGRCCTDYEKAFTNRKKRDTVHDTSKGKYKSRDRVRSMEHECACPRYFIFQGYAGCLPEKWNNRGKKDRRPENWNKRDKQDRRPENWNNRDKQDRRPENWNNRDKQDSHCNNFSFTSLVSDCQFNLKKDRKHVKEHPEATRQKKDPRMARVPRVKPHRLGGVIPKYTGHIPGMLFLFGESYGPASDKLLQRHRDNLAHYKRKS